MRILFLGDITGKSGREAVIRQLPDFKLRYQPDLTIVNGENSAHGKGITTRIYRSLRDAGADVITLGNHAFSKSEIIEKLDECEDLVRPANMAPLNVGKVCVIKEVKGKRVAVVNLLGTIFMDGWTETPYSAMEKLLSDYEADIYFCDLHAETTSEKLIFLNLFADRLSAVVGTHTHVQTADERILKGCAYISDVGMCGAYDSILGRDTEEVLAGTVYGQKTRYVPAEGPAVLCGIIIDLNEEGRAMAVERIQIRPYD